MKHIHKIVALLLLIAPAFGQLNVLTTLPDLKNIVEEIGGEHVSVKSIARGTENIHNVILKPSHLVAASRADVFVQVGLSLEHSFVPGLILRSRNQKIRAGAPGLVTCSDDWKPIQVGMWGKRSQAADAHPNGNPHMNLDPGAGRVFAEKILAGLILADPKHEEVFVERHAEYCKKLTKAEARWAEISKRLASGKVCTYHRDFDYLTDATGMTIVGTIEPKPGVPPTPSDLAKVVELLREEEVRVIMTARWSNNSNLRFVAEKCDAIVLELPTMVRGKGEPSTWIEMMDQLHDSLVKAFDSLKEDK